MSKSYAVQLPLCLLGILENLKMLQLNICAPACSLIVVFRLKFYIKFIETLCVLIKFYELQVENKHENLTRLLRPKERRPNSGWDNTKMWLLTVKTNSISYFLAMRTEIADMPQSTACRNGMLSL